MKHSSTEGRWRRLLAEQDRSGLSVRDFAEQRGLSRWSLYSWRQRLGLSQRRRDRREIPRRGPSAGGELVPVEVIDAVEPAAVEPEHGFHVELREGARIHVPPRFESEDLARLVAVLRSSC